MVTRRSVLKTIAVSLMAPTIQLRQSVPDERLLAAFCDTDVFARYDLNAPFGVGSLTYATDAKAIVRAEIANRHEVGERRLPRVGDVWDRYWHPDNKWAPLTPDDIVPTERCELLATQCPTCGGRRRVSLGDEYPDFDNPQVAESIQECGYDVDDNTILDPSCPTCHGRNFKGKSIFVFRGFKFATCRANRIVALPNVMVCESRAESLSMLFRADGFEGIALGIHS